MFRTCPFLILLAVLPPAVAEAQVPAPVPAPAPGTASVGGGRSAGELLAAGEAAFNGGDWQKAADDFLEFIRNYGGLEGTADAVAKVKPLLGICQVRLGRFAEALPLLEGALKQPDLNAKQRVDLVFFAGLSNLRQGNAEAARKQLGEIFTNPAVERGRRMETLILGGMSYVMEKNWAEGIAFFRRYGDEIAAYSPEAGARSKILLLHALMQEQQWDEAATLARAIHANLDRTRQVVTFSSLLIELGGRFLEDGACHQAISLLRLIPTAAEIERLQTTRLAEAEQDLESAMAGKNLVRTSQIQTAIGEMRRELEAFEKIPQFDSAARLRLAGAYFQLERTREGCLILDQMVRQMEPDAIVEAATASLIRGWMSLERYARAARTADLYEERFAGLAEKPNLADVLFLKAQALEGQFQHEAAADGYRDVATRFPDKPIAAQAEFMAAYNILQLEDYKRAGSLFDQQLKRLKKTDEMWQHVIFWRAMAYYFDQRWDEARGLLGKYLAATKDEGVGLEYVDDSEFRIGYSHFSEARYPEAIQLLSEFSRAHPQSEWLGEALLTLGDSMAAEGDLEGADEAYARIGVEAAGFHDEGWMKRGNLFKLKKDLVGMKKLFTAFVEQRPDSPRIAEGLHWLGWVAKQEGDVAEAKKIYWDAVGRFGNDPVRPGLEDIFIGLQGFYPGAEKLELETLLGDALAKAKSDKQPRFATRLGWALAQLHLTNKNISPELRIRDSREALAALVPEIYPKDTAPRILADVGDALVEKSDFENAAVIYEGLRKWWPRAPERDRAFAGLGFIAARADRELEALASFERYEKSALMPKTAPDARGISLVEGELGGKVALAKAALLSKRDAAKGVDILLALQKAKSMPAAIRAEAFMDAARLHAKGGRHREALPYFEQVYLLFNRFPAMVADAYFERGEALEKLGMPEKAREVYSELVTRGDLASFERAKLGAIRARALGGVIEPSNPEGGLIPPAPAIR
ncbi:MAG: tetratricopeptide repeat protein [Akkermansiaceae bacterium]